MIEGVATFLCRIMSKIIAEFEPRFGGVLDAFIGTSLVVAGNRNCSILYRPVVVLTNIFLKIKSTIAACDYSGGYFNPVLATSLKLNCRGNTVAEHFVVYWVGSIGGSVVSWWVYPFVKENLFSKTSTDKKQK